MNIFTFTFRRVLYFLPVILLVNLLTFFLFFVLNPPDMMAKKILGDKNVTPAAIEKWKRDQTQNGTFPYDYGSDVILEFDRVYQHGLDCSFLQGNICRFVGFSPLCLYDVSLYAFLYYRGPVYLWEIIEAVSDIRI